MNRASIINAILRSINLLLRIFFQFYIISLISFENYGEYSVIRASINTLMFFLGFEYHNYVLREIRSATKTVQFILYHQSVLYIISYLFILPLFYLLFHFDFLNIKIMMLFYLLIIFEHLDTEIFRILVALSRSNIANVFFLLRNGFGGLIIIILLGKYVQYREVNTMLQINISSSFAVFIMSVFAIKKYFPTNIHFDIEYFYQGIKSSLKFFISSGSLILLGIIDIYIYQFLISDSAIGAMTFYRGLTATIGIFIYAIVTSILFPEYLSAFSKNNRQQSKEIFNKIVRYTITITMGMCLILFLLVKPVLLYMGKNILLENYGLFCCYLMSAFIYSIGSLVQMRLFAMSKEGGIAICAVITLISNFVLNIFLISHYNLIGNGVATILTQTVWIFSLIIIFIFNRKYSK